MRVTVFGASGRTGRELVTQGLARGLEVGAFVRDPSRLPAARDQLDVIPGALDDPDALAAAVAGSDAVVSALGVGRPLRSDPEVVEGVRGIVAAMQRTGARRLVYLSFVGVRDSRRRAGPLIRHAAWRVLRHEVADHEAKEAIVAGSGLDWTIVRAPVLTGGPPTGSWRAGEDVAAGALPRLPRADVARFMLDQISDDRFVRRAPSLLP